MDDYSIYLAGEFVTTKNQLEVVNSFNNEIFAKTYLADKILVEKAILKAESTQDVMKNLPSYKKQNILLEISKALAKKERHFAEILAQEACKPIVHAISEVRRAAQVFKIAAEECKRLPKEYMSLDWTSAGENKEGLVKHFPIGLVAGISPFNFPLNLAVHKIAPAIAAGCPIILKPASSTPLTILELAKIIQNTDLPKGALSILPMDRATGNILVTDNRFKLLTFTGSPEVGWKMKSEAGKKRVVLELGGNAACIVTQSADLNLAVKKSIVGAFAYSGQVCIHAQRFFVHTAIFHEFLEKMSKKTTALKFGNPMDVSTDISSMIDEQNAIRVESWVREAENQEAKLIVGGVRQGTFYEPTILTNTKPQMKVNSKEIFGPVITIEPYSEFDEAIELVNGTEFGLQAGIFTNSISEMDEAYRNINVGGLIINDVPTFRVDHMPYGGIKDSGFDREGVKYAINHMMEPKLLVKNC